MAAATTPVELLDLFDKQRAVALATAECGGRANTSEIGDRVGFGAQLVSYHCDRVVEAGFLNDTGERADVGGPIEARVFELTEKGKTAVSQFRGHAEGLTTEARLESLESEVNNLRAENEALKKRHESLVEYLQSEEFVATVENRIGDRHSPSPGVEVGKGVGTDPRSAREEIPKEDDTSSGVE